MGEVLGKFIIISLMLLFSITTIQGNILTNETEGLSNMTKENLVIVHSFPTNSIVLQHLTEYLETYYNVYFIDLPGFTQDSSPLKKISIKNYADALDKKIEEKRIKNYSIAGISFGFWVVSKAKLEGAKGIIAVEPYIGHSSLKMNFLKKYFYRKAINFIIKFNLEQRILKSDWIDKKINRQVGSGKASFVSEQIDPETFFATAKLILENDEMPNFHDLPYVLLINENDHTIKADYIEDIFEEDVEDLLIVKTSLQHYPHNLSKEYFKKKFPKKTINQIENFLNRSR